MIELYDFYTKHLLGTVLIIVCFLIIRFLLRKKSNILKNMLWIILLLRLLFPFSIHTDWGILSPTTFDKEIDTTIPKNEPVSVDMESQVEESENISYVWMSDDIVYKETIDIRIIIWYLGVILFSVYYVISRIHIGKRMKRAGKMPDYDNVYEWQDDFPACVIGVIRPRIYVPCDLKNEQLNVILQHENMHIKRGDYILLILYYLALALNWYNPLCWVVYFMVRSDIEMACDEQVLRNCSKEERQNYARILVQLCSVNAADRFPLVSFAKGKKNIENRVVNIGKHYTYKKWVYFGVGIISVAIIASGVFLYANADNLSDINLTKISEEKSMEDFGADMPRLGYVDETTLFICDYKGIYKFDLPSGQLVDYVDFKEQNLGGLQGDNATEVNFSADGRYIYLRSVNDEVKLIYDTAAKKINSSDFNYENIDLWRAQIAQQDTIENDMYYNVGEIIQQNGEMCFLALQKNMNPNYAALIYVVVHDRLENIYTLFDGESLADVEMDNKIHRLADGRYISHDNGLFERDCVQIDNGIIVGGNEVWELFKTAAQSGKKVAVTLTIKEDGQKYNNRLEYDGEKYIYNDVRYGTIHMKKYLLDLSMKTRDGHGFRWVVLTNQICTASELYKSTYSSFSEDIIDYDFVFGHSY